MVRIIYHNRYLISIFCMKWVLKHWLQAREKDLWVVCLHKDFWRREWNWALPLWSALMYEVIVGVRQNLYYPVRPWKFHFRMNYSISLFTWLFSPIRNIIRGNFYLFIFGCFSSGGKMASGLNEDVCHEELADSVMLCICSFLKLYNWLWHKVRGENHYMYSETEI